LRWGTWLKAVSFTSKLASVLWVGRVVTSVISTFYPSLFVTVSRAARILANLPDPHFHSHLINETWRLPRRRKSHRAISVDCSGQAMTPTPTPQITKCCVHITSHNVSNVWQHNHAEPHGVPTFQATVPTMISVQKRDFEHILYLKLFPLDLLYTYEHL